MSWNELPFDSKEEAISELEGMGYSESDASKIAETLEQEVDMDEGQPETLWESIKEGARNIISDLNLETFSWVENPAQRSQFVMMKSDDEGFESRSPILKEEKDDDWKVAYAPVMVPGEIDKDGEAIPAHIIEKSAHEFLSDGKVSQIDSDHDLITGKGTLVESWILKEDKEYVTPDGEEFKAPKGTWMAGVKPTDEIKERIEAGELQGFSIFGQAEKIKLANRKTFKNKEGVNDTQEDTMGEDSDIDMKEMSENIQAVKEGLNDLSETVSELDNEPEINAKTVDSFEELTEALKAEQPVEFELQEKQATQQEIIDIVGTLTPEGVAADEIASAIGSLYDSDEVESEDDEYDEKEEGDETDGDEKTETEKNREEMTAKQKGADTEEVRNENLEMKEEGAEGKDISYKGSINPV